jgi:hypothetical protein
VQCETLATGDASDRRPVQWAHITEDLGRYSEGSGTLTVDKYSAICAQISLLQCTRASGS